MADSENQDRRAVVFPESDLSRRLLRRGTEPIGVVNVKHAAELHSRASIRLGARLELLDNFKNRYGLGQGTGGTAGTASAVAGSLSLIAPLQRMAAGSLDFAPAPALANRVGSPETATDSASKASSAPQYRVKRPDRLAEPDSSKPLSSVTIAAQSPAAVEVPAGTNPVPAMQRDTNETPSPVSDKPDPSDLPLVRAAEHVDNKPARARDGSLTPSPQVNELPNIATVAPLRVQRKRDDSVATPDFRPAATRDDLVSGGTSPSRSPSSGDLPLQHKVDHPSAHQVVAEEIGRFSTSPDFRPASTREEMPAANARTLPGPSTGDLPLQRKIDPSALPTASSVQTAEPIAARPVADAHQQSHGAVAAELRVAPSPADSTRIVWRKADTNDANPASTTRTPTAAVGPTHTSGLQIMRQAVSEAASNGDAAPAATSVPESNGADVGQIAEQVSRIIARQLRVERERRGRR
jgi:hypothetical protein